MNTARRILAYIRPYWKQLGLSILCSVVFSVFSGVSLYLLIPLLETLFSGNIAPVVATPATSLSPGWLMSIRQGLTDGFKNLVFTGDSSTTLLNICMVILVAFLVKNLAGYLQSNLMIYVEQGLIRDLRNALYRHIHALPLAYFTNERTGNLISRIVNDVPVINTGLTAVFHTMMREPLLILVYLGIALMLSWQLTLISFVVFPLALLVIAYVGRRVHTESGMVQERIASITSVLQETISGVKVVKAFGMEEFENAKFGREAQGLFATVMKVTRIRNLSSPSTEFLSALAGGVIIWYGGMQVLSHESLKASEFIGFLFVMFQMMPPIKELSTVNNRLAEATAAGKRVFEILDTEPNIRNVPDAVRLTGFERDIQFHGVGFRYAEGDEVLRDCNFLIRKGEAVAIVGPSGAGKSTLVDLVPRFYDPTAGRITIDGRDLREVDLKSLRDQIGIVTQETILFNDSVRNNIAYGLDTCPEEALVAAARAANAHAFIIDMPNGYDTVIGERGVKLSGGQRQRLALARAILKNPPLLILDEATSALDTESELLVQEAIERLMAGRTSIVIAHRLSTIQHADRIVVIDGGRITETGKHRDLIRRKNGLYRKLYEMQFRI
jgi:ATP-binding cassette, subfamily B, bacterial MsbA